MSVGGTVVDTYTTPFGIRTFAFSATNGFTLNGAAVKLNGTCNHHDLGALGAAVNTRAIEKRLQQLKAMGVNALRTSHNPPAPEFLDLADRMGFLVMDEAFDCWDQAKNQYDYARFFNQWSATDIGDMVARDRNHPSIIIWSIGNEIQDSNNSTIAQSLIAAVKAKDTTRAIGQAFASASPGAAVAPMEDVVGLNYAPYVYDSLHSSNPSWKFFASESSSAVRSRGVYKTPVTTNILTSSDNQCSSYDNSVVSWGTSAEGSWSSVNTRAFIAGEFIWTGFDYIGEPTPYGWPSKSSYFGAIDTAGLPEGHLLLLSEQVERRGTDDGPHRADGLDQLDGRPGRHRVGLHQRGQRRALPQRHVAGLEDHDPARPRTFNGRSPSRPGTLEAKATKGGAVVATDTVKTAGAAAKLALSPDRATIKADGRDLAYVEVDIVDAQGVVVSQGQQHDRRLGHRSGHPGGPRRRRFDEPRLVQGHVPRRLQRQADGHRPVDDDAGDNHGDRVLRSSHRRLGGRHDDAIDSQPSAVLGGGSAAPSRRTSGASSRRARGAASAPGPETRSARGRRGSGGRRDGTHRSARAARARPRAWGCPRARRRGVFSLSCVTASCKSPSRRKVLFHGKSRREADTTYFGLASSLRAHSRIARGAFSSRATAGQALSMSS